MRGLYSVLLLVLAIAISAILLGVAAAPADAHRSGCHRWHTCPSDHATYRWRGLLCVAPYSDIYNRSFNRRVVYEGRTYYCKR